MAYYSDDVIENVKRSNNIVDVIGSYISLKKQSSNYWGVCPFHNDTSPSLSVSESKQIFKCFACQTGGNVISFVMNYENLNFHEALKLLADRAGIKLPETEYSPDAGIKEKKKNDLLEIYKQAALYYVDVLKSPEGAAGLEYFKNRGLLPGTMTRFGLGFSPAKDSRLYSLLKEKGYEDEILLESALFKYSEQYGITDTFWNRVMFPIMDRHNKVIGFGGRVMGDAKPKYINSSDTLIFDKGRNIYGLNIAGKSRESFFLLCEGYMDVIALHQAGFDNAVATLGTALTENQASILARYKKNVIITYDSDGPGIKAALRAIDILGDAGISVKILDMKPHKDPDEFIKALGRDEYIKRIENAKSAFYFRTDNMADEFDMSNPDDKIEYINKSADLLSDVYDEIERKVYIEAFANRYGIKAGDLERKVNAVAASKDINRASKPAARKLQFTDGSDEDINRRVDSKQALVLTMSSEKPEYARLFLKYFEEEDFEEGPVRDCAKMVYEQLKNGSPIAKPDVIISRFETAADQSFVAGLFETEFARDVIEEKNKSDKAFAEALANCKKQGLTNSLKKALSTGAMTMSEFSAKKKEYGDLEKVILNELKR